MKVLITCPPMLRRIEEFRSIFTEKGIALITPNVVQVLSEEELIKLVPTVDAWIIGDDPATRKVFEAGKAGNLKAAVKWGVGVDNVDFTACKDLEIPIITYKLGPDPNMKDYFYISLQFFNDKVVNGKISNKIDPLIMPIVLEQPIEITVPLGLFRKNQQKWTSEETVYWGKQKIKDIGIVDFKF